LPANFEVNDSQIVPTVSTQLQVPPEKGINTLSYSHQEKPGGLGLWEVS
jgi:hypothetical protein